MSKPKTTDRNQSPDSLKDVDSSIFTLKTGADNRVIDLNFSQPLHHIVERFEFGTTSHEQLAEEIVEKDWATGSIIVIEQRLDLKYVDNPLYVRKPTMFYAVRSRPRQGEERSTST